MHEHCREAICSGGFTDHGGTLPSVRAEKPCSRRSYESAADSRNKILLRYPIMLRTLHQMTHFKLRHFLFVSLILADSGTSRLSATDYPVAKRGPQFDDYFGQKILDPYRWLEDIDSKKTDKWIDAERAFTAAAFAEMPERQAIRSGLMELWDSPRFGLPSKRGGRLFFMKNDGLQDEDILFMADGKGSIPSVVIDPNLLSAEGTYAVTGFSPTDDGKLVGYGLSAPDSERSELRVRDVATGKDLPDAIHSAKSASLSWTKDGSGFFYCRFPDTPRKEDPIGELAGEKLFYHILGTDQSADSVIFQTKGQSEQSLDGSVSDDGRYLIVTVARDSITQKALFYVDLVDPAVPHVKGPIVTLFDKFDADYTFVGNKGSIFYVLTTLNAPRGKVVSVDVASSGPPALRSVIPEDGDTIDQAAYSGRRFVVSRLHNAESRLALYNGNGSLQSRIAVPEMCAVDGISARADDPEMFYRFSSFLVPPSIMRRNVETGSEAIFERSQTSIDLSRFETKQVFFKSTDGTQIPLFITARKDLKLDGSCPTWLLSHGGCNVSLKPAFTLPLALWLELGGVCAQAIVRGGGEFGEEWHRSGTKERKQNVFDDFTAAARYLVAQGYTQTDRLVIDGNLGGGLLVAVVINQHPDLCAVALPDQGVMDMLRYHKLMSGGEWKAEYGTSEDAAGFRYLLAYSPIHNAVYGGKYPGVLITTEDHDDRVSPGHSFKYAAAMQAAIRTTPEERPILIRIGSGVGRGGLNGTFPVAKAIDEWADRMGFAAHFMPAGTLGLPKLNGP